MQAYKIIVAYDGTDFHGWQIQPQDITITSCLQDAWRNLFGQPITLIGASRTDAGVHALGQVARFFATPPATLSPEDIRTIWNSRLPASIHIRSLAKIDNPNFHPCANVKQKTYYYTLFLKRPLPHVARYGWHYCFIDQVNLETFYNGLQLYRGTHDFGSFCKIEDDRTTTIRTIDDISVKRFNNWNALMVTVKGPGFARFQIRRMIGYALDVARRPELGINYLKDVLQNPNPQQTLLKADGHGLCLRKVVYHNDQQ
jgi:tRNA pseudouridine38-40 synthase